MYWNRSESLQIQRISTGCATSASKMFSGCLLDHLSFVNHAICNKHPQNLVGEVTPTWRNIFFGCNAGIHTLVMIAFNRNALLDKIPEQRHFISKRLKFRVSVASQHTLVWPLLKAPDSTSAQYWTGDADSLCCWLCDPYHSYITVCTNILLWRLAKLNALALRGLQVIVIGPCDAASCSSVDSMS